MNFILWVVITIANNGVSVHSAEYANESACLEAAKEAQQLRSANRFAEISAVCTNKGSYK